MAESAVQVNVGKDRHSRREVKERLRRPPRMLDAAGVIPMQS